MRSADHDQPYSYPESGGTPYVPASPPSRVLEAMASNDAAAEVFNAGRYDEAVPMFEQTLASVRAALGKDHPETMTVAGNLAVAHFAAGNRRRGLKLIVGNVSDRVRVLGDEHPDTLIARGALATAYRVTGDADTAIAISKQLVVQCTRAFGPAYDATLIYARDRKAFGQSIGSFQMIQQKIADMKCKLDASYWLVLRAAWAKHQAEKSGGKFSTEAAVAKLTASESAMWITHQAIQVHGGMGYSKEMPLERYFRDAKITEIYEGTSEIQRMVIARNETGLR